MLSAVPAMVSNLSTSLAADSICNILPSHKDLLTTYSLLTPASVTSVCLFVCTLKGKWLELSTPNLVVVARHALTQRSKGRGHTVTKNVTVARLLVMRAATAVCCCCRRGSACRYDCLCFLVRLNFFVCY